jgi:O-acetyl-ADP-ribose deacetylase (regulator of RNase III)
MLTFTHGNLLEAKVEAMVNTVNTVGVMGKGIALMFKERFPANFKAYEAACARGEVQTGTMFVTESPDLFGPRWIINFPTKQHWRGKTELRWIEDGLADLVRVVRELGIRSIAIPPLGCGNGGLDWGKVRPLVERAFLDLQGVETVVFEPTQQYQAVAKRQGVLKLTPARALVADMVRRYSLLGIECSVLEVQKLAWFLERFAGTQAGLAPLEFGHGPARYGPYSDRLRHLLDSLDSSYLHCDRRLSDARPGDPIRFEDGQKERIAAYLGSDDAKAYQPVLEGATRLIDGFESPLGMELLATVDWLVWKEGVEPSVAPVRQGLAAWKGGEGAAARKLRLFDDRLIGLALDQLNRAGPGAG